MKRLNIHLTIFLFISGLYTNAQGIHYNLQQMLKENKIATIPAYETRALTGEKPDAITTKGIVWLKGIDFTGGTVDIDLRGKDVFLQSFLGIVFFGTDTSHCNIIYFRPFNFRHTDSARWKWSLAYMQIPDFNYARLRKEHPGVYENRIVPPPVASDWFHATIVISSHHATVYVNHNENPSLDVSLLDGRSDGLFGLYSDGLTNDFANLTITKYSPGIVRNNNFSWFNFAQLYQEHGFEPGMNDRVELSDDKDKPAVSISGVVWLRDVEFAKGTIDIDLRGKNEQGQSFLGIAFSGEDPIVYDQQSIDRPVYWIVWLWLLVKY